MSEKKEQDPKNLPFEKDNPNLTTVFVCFLKSGLRFTRYDTNNVGLAFIDEIKKHNPGFKPTKVQQRERNKIYVVNAYPKEFEPLIMSLIEEYRKKHNMEYRLKKSGRGPGGPRHGSGQRGGYNRDQRGGYNRDQRGGYNRDQRGGGYNRDQGGGGNYGRPRRDNQSGYGQRGDNRDGGYRPRRRYDDQQGDSSRGNRSGGYGNDGRRQSDGTSYRPRRDGDQNFNRDGYSPSPNRYSGDDKDGEYRRPRRPRREA